MENANPASSEGFPASSGLPYVGPVPVVTSDAKVEPAPPMTSDVELPPGLIASEAGLICVVLASVPLVSQALPSGSISLPPSSRDGGSGLSLRPVGDSNTVSAPVGLPTLYQTEMIAAQVEFARHGRFVPVEGPELVAALPGLFREVTASAAADNPADPDLRVVSADDVTKLIAERDT